MKPYNKPPPDERPNWHKLNEGQRRYAWEQYNLALIRRGHKFDSPVAEPVEEPVDPDPEPSAEELLHEGVNPEATAEEDDYDELLRHLESDNTGTGNRMPPPNTSGGSAVSSSSGGPSGAKKRKADDSAKSKLPGTGGEGTPMEGGPRSAPLPRPSLELQCHSYEYIKVHRFYTYGIAYDIINVAEGDPVRNWKFLTTPLANIPWDRPYFYLTPAEYNVLPMGAVCKSVSVSIIPRNVRIAFPTNSTANNLATLNQNKDIIIAKGLSTTCHSINAHYTKFQDTQPMIPSEFEIEKYPDHLDLDKDLYGSELSARVDVVPRHQVGIATPLPHYALIPKAEPENAGQDIGWPCLQHYYTDFDADSTSGNTIETVSYEPEVGFLKETIPAYYAGYPTVYKDQGPETDIIVPRGSHSFQRHNTKIQFRNADSNNAEPKDISDTPQLMTRASDQNFGRYRCIEKSQWMQFGNFQSQGPKIQHSLHIGVQPVHALTTAALQGQSNSSFTDSCAYFEVIARMTVEASAPTPFPLPATIHTTEHGMVWKGQDIADIGKSTFNGLYQSL